MAMERHRTVPETHLPFLTDGHQELANTDLCVAGGNASPISLICDGMIIIANNQFWLRECWNRPPLPGAIGFWPGGTCAIRHWGISIALVGYDCPHQYR